MVNWLWFYSGER